MSFFDSKIRSTLFVSAAATGVALVAPSIAEASFGENTLRQGMENSEVKQLQERLKDEGYFTHHTATGYFGDITRRAVVAFQKDNNLAQDGIVGPQTFSVLNGNRSNSSNTGSSNSSNNSSSSSNNSSSSSSSSSSVSVQAISNTSQVMRQGTSNSDVARVQAYLKKAGFYSGTATGNYGNLTQQSVRSFQQARGLTVDGLAGPQTLSRINSEINSTSGSSGSNNSSSGSNSSSSNASSDSSSSSSLSGVILRQGSRGANVRTLQTRLKDSGFLSGSVDGIFGPQTANAVRDLQRQANITVDGVFGPQTLRQLDNNIKKNGNSSSGSNSGSNNNGSSNSGSSDSSSDVLKEGSRGSNVTELQNMLRALGHLNGRADGIFGPQTKAALVKFQKDWDLVSDGIATTSTWNKLQEVSSVHKGDSSSNSGGSSNSSFNTMNLIADASNYLGVPYLWGGTTASGFDCSGFIQHVFRNNGVNLPRTVAQQWNATKAVSSPKVGDIVYFETYTSGPSHNGIYIGNNQFIHSGSSTGVTVTSMSNSYWQQRYLGARTAN